MNASPKVSYPCIWQRCTIAIGIVLVSYFYAWTNRMDPNSWNVGGPQVDYYNLLMHGFLKGHLYMDVEVAEELKACPDP